MKKAAVRLIACLSACSFLGSCGVYLNGSGVSSISPDAAELTSQIASEGSLKFGPVFISNTSSKSFEIENSSDYDLDSVLVENPPTPFSIASENCSSGISKGASCTVTLNFSPESAGSFTEEIMLRYTVGSTAVSQSKTLVGSCISPTELLGSDDSGQNSPEGNRYGYEVSIANGYMAIGAYQDNSVAIYEYNGSSWDFSERLDGPIGSTYFGKAVDMGGDWLAVGAPYSNSAGTNRGLVYVYQLNSGTGLFEIHPDAPLAASDESDNALFGSSLAIEVNDGLDIVQLFIGSPGHGGTGKAYIFDWDSTGDTWAQDLSLTGDGDPGALFGTSVSFNSQYGVPGETRTVLAVGAPGDTESALNGAGAVYTFEDPGGGFALLEKITPSDAIANHNFGQSVFLRAFDLLVGAPGDADNGADSGAAYSYNLTGPSWSFTSKLKPEEGSAGDEFGSRVLKFGDKNLIGAPKASPAGSSRGALYIFEDIGGAVYETRIYDEGLASNSEFGSDFDVNGDFILVGAPYDDADGIESGAALVYDSKAMDRQALTHPTDSLDRLGNESAVLGNIAAIGDDNGEIVIYQKNSSGTWSFLQSLIPAGLTSTDEIALYGDWLVFGDSDRNSDEGVVEVYKFDGDLYQHEDTLSYSSAASNEDCGDSVAIWGNRLAMGCDRANGGGTEQGMVVTFTYDGSTWVEDSSVLYASDPEDFAEFGASVRMDADFLVIGALNHDNDGVTPGDSGNDEGVAYVYQHDGSSWNFLQRLSLADASDAQPNARFGYRVDVSGDWLVVNANDYDVGGVQGTGELYFYQFDGSNWNYTQRIDLPYEPFAVSRGAALGKKLELSGDTLVAMDDDDSDVADTENARIYKLKSGTWEYQRTVFPSPQLVNMADESTSISTDGSTLVLGISLQPIPGSTDQGQIYIFDLDVLNPYQ